MISEQTEANLSQQASGSFFLDLLRKILSAFIFILFMECGLLLLFSLSCNTILHSAPAYMVP